MIWKQLYTITSKMNQNELTLDGSNDLLHKESTNKSSQIDNITINQIEENDSLKIESFKMNQILIDENLNNKINLLNSNLETSLIYNGPKENHEPHIHSNGIRDINEINEINDINRIELTPTNSNHSNHSTYSLSNGNSSSLDKENNIEIIISEEEKQQELNISVEYNNNFSFSENSQSITSNDLNVNNNISDSKIQETSSEKTPTSSKTKRNSLSSLISFSRKNSKGSNLARSSSTISSTNIKNSETSDNFLHVDNNEHHHHHHMNGKEWHLDQDTYNIYLSLIPKKYHTHLRHRNHLRLFIKRNSLPKSYRLIIYHLLCRLKYLTDPNVKRQYNNLYGKLSNQDPISSMEKNIRKDLQRTFPEFDLFKKDEIREELFRILKSYGVMDSIVGYTQGMAFIGGFLLCLSHWGIEASQSTSTLGENTTSQLTESSRSRSNSNTSSFSSIDSDDANDSNLYNNDNQDSIQLNQANPTNETEHTKQADQADQIEEIDQEDENEDEEESEEENDCIVSEHECSVFWIFTSMMNNLKWDAKSLFIPELPKLFEIMYCVEQTIKKESPTLFEWLEERSINTEIYAAQFIMTLCTNHFKPEVIERIWDLFFLDGWIWIVRLVSSVIIENQSIKFESLDASDFVPRIYNKCSTYTADDIIKIMDNLRFEDSDFEKLLKEYESQLPEQKIKRKKYQTKLMEEFIEKNENIIQENDLMDKINTLKIKRKKSMFNRILNTFSRKR